MARYRINKATEVLSFNALKTLTRSELERRTFTFRKLPLCLKINTDKYIVGRYKVINTDNGWVVTDINSTVVLNNYTNAMLYCVCMQTKNEEEALDIARLDKHVAVLKLDNLAFKARLTAAMQTQDQWKQDLYTARYLQTSALIQVVSKELEKKINLAKYYKLRDFKL